MLELIVVFVFDWIEVPSVVQTMYPSALTANSQTYSRDCQSSNFYYETVHLNVTTNGFYSLSSSSTIDTYGYIYKDNFNPLKPSENLLVQDDNNCNNNQFKLITELNTSTTYILVVTTYHPAKTEQFSILISGPNNVNVDLNHNGECL